MNGYLNFSNSEADKREQREQEMGLNVDSSKVKNSINYGSLLNYSSNAKDNYLNRIKKKDNYAWDIKSTLDNLYPEEKKQNKIRRKINFKLPVFFAERIPLQQMRGWEKEHDRRNKITRGSLDIIKEYAVTRPLARTYERIMDEKLLREVAFPFKSINHIRAAIDIGKGIDGSDNLSSTAERFALEYDKLYEKDKPGKIEEGRNAIRHTLWQGALSSKYGPKIARDAGDSHETRPYIDVSIRDFDKDTDADMVTDLLNNKIGRRIGAMYPGSSRKELALRVLEEYWKSGLYSYEQGRDGRWYVRKRTIPNDVFNALYKKYKN